MWVGERWIADVERAFTRDDNTTVKADDRKPKPTVNIN